jgi:hypothetical protein
MRYLVLIPFLGLAACDTVRTAADKVGTSVGGLFRPEPAPTATTPAPGGSSGSETAPGEAVGPPLSAIPDTGGTDVLAAPSQTIAGLGDPSKPGPWLETPLVTAEQPGRVTYRATGASVNVTLRPIPGEATAGSRLSLEAMRGLGAPLTELVEVVVHPAS